MQFYSNCNEKPVDFGHRHDAIDYITNTLNISDALTHSVRLPLPPTHILSVCVGSLAPVNFFPTFQDLTKALSYRPFVGLFCKYFFSFSLEYTDCVLRPCIIYQFTCILLCICVCVCESVFLVTGLIPYENVNWLATEMDSRMCNSHSPFMQLQFTFCMALGWENEREGNENGIEEFSMFADH